MPFFAAQVYVRPSEIEITKTYYVYKAPEQ